MICAPGLVPEVCIICVARARPGTYKAQVGKNKKQKTKQQQQQKTTTTKNWKPGRCYNY